MELASRLIQSGTVERMESLAVMMGLVRLPMDWLKEKQPMDWLVEREPMFWLVEEREPMIWLETELPMFWLEKKVIDQ